MKTPIRAGKYSHKKVCWVCDCGREKLIKINNVSHGFSTNCGNCKQLKTEYWAQAVFGKLKLKEPQDLHPKSAKKLIWVCSCGREKNAVVHSVVNGSVTRCGICTANIFTSDYLSTQKFGKWRILEIRDLTPGSNRKILCICDCGVQKQVLISDLFAGKSKSCGTCFLSIKKLYDESRELIHSLKIPIQPNQLPPWIKFFEPILRTSTPIRALCPLCLNEYFPRWNNVRKGASLTCGCSQNRISSGQYEVFKFISSLGLEPILEHRIDNYKFDIGIPIKRILIEYNGMKWHSSEIRKSGDARKQDFARARGWQIQIVTDREWLTHPNEVRLRLSAL